MSVPYSICEVPATALSQKIVTDSVFIAETATLLMEDASMIFL